MSRGSFWVLGESVTTPVGPVPRGQMYVEWEAPESPTRPPVVLVHGGGGQGTDFLTTPDGRPGWGPLLVERGYPVYVVDRPGHGRSPFDPALLGPTTPTWGADILKGVFLGGPPLPPNTQWPEDADALDQFAASQGPLSADLPAMQALDRDRLVQLLERVGPAILLAHSAGGPGAWLAADARPQLVSAFVAVETMGPPFVGQPDAGFPLPWGLAAVPLTYDPPAADPAELRLVTGDEVPVPKVLQAEPARTLPNLARVPVAVVTAQTSPFRLFDAHLVEFLEQAGVTTTLLRLEDSGITGNGHGMMLERNNADVLGVITDWLDGHVSGS